MWKALIAATCMDLKMIILSEEVREIDTNEFIYKTETDLQI